MAKPEKRWQLLLVADDGRIIPFKRIKGIGVTLAILLVLLGLACAGLGWQLTAEKVRHRRTLVQLADANRQVVHYKSENELITTELVLAEARMQKAGIVIPQRQARVTLPKAAEADAEPLSDRNSADGQQAPQPAAKADTTASPTTPEPPSAKATATPVASAAKATAPEATAAEATAAPASPMVALGDLEIKHDTGKKSLVARFRVNNAGPRSSPVAGRCVVVLKSDHLDPEAWLAMPGVTLVNGHPNGERGQAFQISRFRDMEVKAMGQTDPSSFSTATIYVFDTSGAKLLEKEYPIDLPAPKPAPRSVSAPAVRSAAEPETDGAPEVPVELPLAKMPIDRRPPAAGADGAAGNLPLANPSDANAGAAVPPVPTDTPVEDPSPTGSVEPAEREDPRARY